MPDLSRGRAGRRLLRAAGVQPDDVDAGQAVARDHVVEALSIRPLSAVWLKDSSPWPARVRRTAPGRNRACGPSCFGHYAWSRRDSCLSRSIGFLELVANVAEVTQYRAQLLARAVRGFPEIGGEDGEVF